MRTFAAAIRTGALATVVLLVGAVPKEERDGRGDIQARMGLRYAAVEDLVVGAAIGRSFTSDPQVEIFATVGLPWTVDAPWKRRSR